MKSRFPIFLLTISLAFTTLVTAQTRVTQKIKQLSRLTTECNMKIEIQNVNNKYVDHKSHLNLLLDDKLVRRLPATQNKDNVVFYFNMPPGEHKVKAAYYLINGWNNKRYEINPKQQTVRINKNQRTILSIKLNKKRNGQLKRCKNYFNQSAESIYQTRVIRNQKRTNQQKLNNTNNQIRTHQANKSRSRIPNQKATVIENKIPLQINTIPINAEVIVDDKNLGHAPVIVQVERDKDHVVQIYCTGYKGKMKLIQKSELVNKEKFIVMEELERER